MAQKMKRPVSRAAKIVVIAAAVIVVAGLLLGRVIGSRRKAGNRPAYQTYEVQTGEVDSTVSATGNISMDDTEDVVVSTGVIVDEVLVEAGDEVKKGDTLAKLDKTSVVSALVEAKDTKDDLEDQLDEDDRTSLEKEKIHGEIDEVEERIDALDKLHDNPVIKATKSGTIQTVNVSEGAEIANTVSTQTGTGTSTDDSSTDYSSYFSTSDAGGASSRADHSDREAVQTASVPQETGTGNIAALTRKTGMGNIASVPQKTGAGDTSVMTGSGLSANPSVGSGFGGDVRAVRLSAQETESTTEEAEDTVIMDLNAVTVTTPVTGNAPQTSVATTDMYSGTISWNPPTAAFQADTSYTATIILTAKDGYIFRGSYAGGTVSDSGRTLTITQTYKTAAESTTQTSESTTSAQGTTSPQTSATYPASGTTQPSVSYPTSGTSNLSGLNGLSNSSLSSSSASTSPDAEFYGKYEAAAFTILTGDDVKIVVSVDELDILSVAKDQETRITLDALPDEEFSGKIQEIASTGTTSNGSTKYEVTISIEKQEQIMDGMSASVVIVTDSEENAVLIPVSALQEEDGEKFVYTSVDQDGNLGGKTTVETGISDGTNVQITSGLSEGDTIYYANVDVDTDVDDLMEQGQQNRQNLLNGNGNNGNNGGGGNGGGGPAPGGSGGGQ